jgi:hypothetical protein
MSDSKKDDKSSDNIFKIIDGVIFQLNRTKKMFIIMILTLMIIPPIATMVTFAVLAPPFEQTNEQKEHGWERFGHGFMPLRFLPIAISSIWLIIGIRQWFVLSKWTKKYDQYKELQEKIDKKLDDEDDTSNQK